MTAEDIRKYAKEKRLPKRAIDNMVRRLKEDYPGDIDDMTYHAIIAYIDRSAEYWEGVRCFLETPKEKRVINKKHKDK